MAYGFTKVTLTREAGSSNVWAMWGVKKNDTLAAKAVDTKKKGTSSYKYKRKEFSYRWYYQVVKGSTWYPASNSNSTVGKNETKVSYGFPSNAVAVRISIKPVMYPINKKAKKAADKVYECPKFDANVVDLSIDTSIPTQPEDLTPSTISSISSNIDKSNNLTLTATISNDEYTKKGVSIVEFEVYMGTTTSSTQNYKRFGGTTATVYNNKASYYVKLSAGFYYIYRARAKGTKGYGQWSEFSDYTEKIVTSASKPVWVVDPTAAGSNIAKLQFKCTGYAEEYEIEYAIRELYLNADDGIAQTKSVREESPEATNHNITTYVDNLEAGNTYYFHIRAKSNKFDPTGWSEIRSVTIGREPAAPTTYSSKTSAIIGDSAYLYWVHNSQDGSSQRDARIAIYMNQTSTMLGNATIDISNPYFEDDLHDYLQDKTLFHKIDFVENSKYAGPKSNRTYTFVDGDVLYWRVCTRGVYTGTSTNGNGYGPWSAMRKITIFEPPHAYLTFRKGWLWDPLNLRDHTVRLDQLEKVTIIDRYPYIVEMEATPASQEAISFNLTITNAGGAYETENSYGETMVVGAGEVVYQNYFDANINPESGNYYFDEENENHMALQLMPNDVDFVNGQTYNFHLEVYMNSGLYAEASEDVPARLIETSNFEPSADIETDQDELVAYISPVCYDMDLVEMDPETNEIDEEDLLEHLTEDVLLSVYRIETDGTFTEIETDIENTGFVTITDPHPSLDYARYRIVAVKTSSGDIRYQDYYAYEMGVHALVLQWDESWTIAENNAEAFTDENELSNAETFRAMTNYKGNRIVLPWNIDMTESFDPDVALVEYIGREHPVSYYGTQLGQSASWSTDIVKYNYESAEYVDFDTNTLFQLRKLARYMGDVYVREPSGTGYWANVRVNWTQTHNEQVIPVSIEIKRVEGKKESSLERI